MPMEPPVLLHRAGGSAGWWSQIELIRWHDGAGVFAEPWHWSYPLPFFKSFSVASFFFAAVCLPLTCCHVLFLHLHLHHTASEIVHESELCCCKSCLSVSRWAWDVWIFFLWTFLWHDGGGAYAEKLHCSWYALTSSVGVVTFASGALVMFLSHSFVPFYFALSKLLDILRQWSWLVTVFGRCSSPCGPQHVDALEVLLQGLCGGLRETIKVHEICLKTGPNLGVNSNFCFLFAAEFITVSGNFTIQRLITIFSRRGGVWSPPVLLIIPAGTCLVRFSSFISERLPDWLWYDYLLSVKVGGTFLKYCRLQLLAVSTIYRNRPVNVAQRSKQGPQYHSRNPWSCGGSNAWHQYTLTSRNYTSLNLRDH